MLLFADAQNGVVGAAHAGWKGALTGMIEATIAAMEAKGARRANIHIALGPMISGESYEVGPEFATRFLAEVPIMRVSFRPRRARWPFDVRPPGLYRGAHSKARYRVF